MRSVFIFLFLTQFAFAQFAPPVGQPGTTAMYKDSSAFIAWADFCVVQRGLQDISNTSGPYANVGDSSKAIGIADNGIVSLGDGGSAICTFAQPITDAPGPDFAVFENSFSDDYLEFGFVEVSSDGVNFFRFPVTSNIQDTTQTGSFGLSDASLVNNLAGKYRALYGTPFDLSELQSVSGLNINSITHVKIVDVVGDIDPLYATHDKNGKKINDPWPTAFGSCGFDLDAVGVIHNAANSVGKNEKGIFVRVFPNPANELVYISSSSEIKNIQIVDVYGNVAFSGNTKTIDVSQVKAGVYFIYIQMDSGSATEKMIIGK